MATIKTSKRSRKTASKKTNNKVRVVYRTKECDKEHGSGESGSGGVQKLYAWRKLSGNYPIECCYSTSINEGVADMLYWSGLMAPDFDKAKGDGYITVQRKGFTISNNDGTLRAEGFGAVYERNSSKDFTSQEY